MTRHELSPRLTASAVLALLLTAAPHAPAQERAMLDDLSASHTISTDTVAQLSFEGLDVAPDVQARVFGLPGGGWGVSSGVFPGIIQRFDAAGAPAGTFGHAGHGPGELGGEIFAVPLRDELWVLDPQNARLSIYTKELHFAESRRAQVQPVLSIVPAHDGRSVLVSGPTRVGEMRYAVTRLSRDPGADVVGVPLGRQPLPVSQWLVQRRRAAETADGEVWAVATSGGVIDVLRSGDLSLVARLQLPGEEMAREAPWGVSDFAERPAPRLFGITADSAGLLWASFIVADSTWKPGMDPRDGLEEYWDTRVLAIDPARRAIVGTVQLEPVCLPVAVRLLSCVDEVGQTIRLVAFQLDDAGPAMPTSSHLAVVIVAACGVVLAGVVAQRAFVRRRRQARP